MPDNDAMAFGSEALRALRDFMKSQFLDIIYPVGTIYTSVNDASPATFLGGIWEALDEGRVLIGCNSSYPAGSTGGEATHKLTVSEMPGHAHSVHVNATTDSKGSHSHSLEDVSIDIDSDGSHSHTRGTMNITGSFTVVNPNDGTTAGAFSSSVFDNHGRDTEADKDYFKSRTISMSAQNGWSGSTSSGGSHGHTGSLSGSMKTSGSHTHTINQTFTSASAGSNAAHNNMQPYLSVYMWKRTA